MKKYLKIIICSISLFTLVSCEKDEAAGELIVDAMVAEPGDVLNKAFPNTKVRVEGSGLSGIKEILLDDKIKVGFNSNYNSDKAFIFTVPFDEANGSRFGIQPITFTSSKGSITKQFEILQPAPTFFRTIPERAVPGQSLEIEGQWFINIISVKLAGSAISYDLNSSSSLEVVLPANAVSGSELEIATAGGTLAIPINFITIVNVTDFDGGGVRLGSSWFFYGDLASFNNSATGGPTGNHGEISWTGATANGFNGCSGGMGPGAGVSFLNNTSTDANRAKITMDVSVNVVNAHLAVQLNTIEGKNYGYNIKITETNWSNITLLLKDFKDNYGYGANLATDLDVSKINEIKIGIVQGDTPNPTIISFDNIKFIYD